MIALSYSIERKSKQVSFQAPCLTVRVQKWVIRAIVTAEAAVLTFSHSHVISDVAFSSHLEKWSA